MKSHIEVLERKVEAKDKNEIEEIIKKKEDVDKSIMANKEAISNIEKEMKEIAHKGFAREIIGDTNNVQTSDAQKPKRRCKYYNRGYCKYNGKCRFIHPSEICESHLAGQTCERSECSSRHPRTCKWLRTNEGCRRQNCEYLHSDHVQRKSVVDRACKYKCEGCEHIWEEKKFVVEHSILNRRAYFCLNCDDWIVNKFAVFEAGWTLFDTEGQLRQDV